MTITDDLLEGARALRDALDALEFSMKSTVLQRGHVIIPDDEVTGEYLASLPVGLALDERERAAAYAETVYLGAAVLHQDMNVGYAVANMFPDLCAVDRGIIDVTVNGAIERIAREGSGLEETLVFDIPADESHHREPLLAVVELYGYEPLAPNVNKGLRTQVLVRLTQANPDIPGVNEQTVQDIVNMLNVSDKMRAGMSAYTLTGNAQSIRDSF